VEIKAAPGGRGKPGLTQDAFDRFLGTLHADREAAGARYVDVRDKLVRFFEWRGCPDPNEHADEAITRTVKRISEGEVIREPEQYVVGVARLLVFEIHRDRARQQRMTAQIDPPYTPVESTDAQERRTACLKRCLETLPPADRDLILQYYEGDKGAKIRNRRRLTDRLEVSLNTLRTRALRIRQRLQACVATCMDNERSPRHGSMNQTVRTER
jgi:DNA-directed RNA polymerase specialized sigma24 family protein